MIPTITILTERIHRILRRGDVQRDSAWDDRDFEYLIRDFAAKLIKGDWYATREEGGKNIDSRYVAQLGAKIEKDANTGENYSVIPVSNWLRLPDESGIQSVRPDTSTLGSKKTKPEEIRAFIPIPNRFMDIYLNLPAGALEGQYGYMVRKNKVFYTKKFNKTLLEDGIKDVLMDIVTVDPAAVGVDDPLPLPEEMVAELISQVLQMMGVVEAKAKDLTNNENVNV